MAAPKSSPKDAQVMAQILKDMGVQDYEPRVINQMLEFTYRYVTDVLDDAKVYSSHAGKKTIDVDDVKLAVQCKLDHSFTTPPPRDLLMDVAKHKNNISLPLIKPYTGPKLPPDRYCLIQPNYKLKSLKKPKPQPTIAPTPRFAIQASPQIKAGSSVLSSNLSILQRGATTPTVTIRPATAPINVAPPVPAMPIIRVNTGGIPPPRPQTMTMGGLDGFGFKRKREDDDYDV